VPKTTDRYTVRELGPGQWVVAPKAVPNFRLVSPSKPAKPSSSSESSQRQRTSS
jgi:hypothetical protein